MKHLTIISKVWLKTVMPVIYFIRQLTQTAKNSSRINIDIVVHFTGCVKTNPSIYAGGYDEKTEPGL